jgi:small-conductance mechanosensitive channel
MAIVFERKALGRRGLVRNMALLAAGVAGHFVIHGGMIRNDVMMMILDRLDIAFIVIAAILICNSLLMIFLDIYSHTDKSRNRPMKALVQAIQVIMVFLGVIICVAVLINKSPKALLTGLGASAAVLMLVFKDSILGFVAGVQLMQNNMVQIGDWIQMPDGSANGNIIEINLNTVKVQNWDNTITTIPPYTLISAPFKNWRGMMESGGRRVDKMINLDVTSLEICSEDMIQDLKKNIPLMKDYNLKSSETLPTNSQLYRYYIEKYLRAHSLVAQELDLIIAQRQQGQFGLPIEVYFFIRDKVWNEYEKYQSDIFDHLLAMVPEFGLKLYQLPT